MKILDHLIKKNEKKPPRKNKMSEKKVIDWNDFNYPESYPLIHYNPEEIEDEER